MATQPIGPHSPLHWYASSPTCNRAYLLAGLRAGVIALVLLTVLTAVALL